MKNRIFFCVAVLAVIFGINRCMVALLGEPTTANGYLVVLGLCTLAALAVFVTASWVIHAAKVQARTDRKPLIALLCFTGASVGTAVLCTALALTHPAFIVAASAFLNALAAAIAGQAVLYG